MDVRVPSFRYVKTPGKSVTPMVAEALLVTSATLVAVTKYTPPAVGAVYCTEVEVVALSVPQAFPKQPEPETLHVTPLFNESFTTVAAKTIDLERVRP
jgi:hypothetical protein